MKGNERVSGAAVARRPIVMAAGRELSYMILTGCLLCYATTYAIIARNSPFTCGIQRFTIGYSFAMIYSALLTKTNRIARIFQSATRSARRPPFISPKSQLLISTLLVLVQVRPNSGTVDISVTVCSFSDSRSDSYR